MEWKEIQKEMYILAGKAVVKVISGEVPQPIVFVIRGEESMGFLLKGKEGDLARINRELQEFKPEVVFVVGQFLWKSVDNENESDRLFLKESVESLPSKIEANDLIPSVCVIATSETLSQTWVFPFSEGRGNTCFEAPLVVDAILFTGDLTKGLWK